LAKTFYVYRAVPTLTLAELYHHSGGVGGMKVVSLQKTKYAKPSL